MKKKILKQLEEKEILYTDFGEKCKGIISDLR